MSQQLVNDLLIGGMAVIFLLIVGVLGAMRGKRPAAAPVPAWADADGVDLEDRLRKITLSAVKSAEDVAAVAAPPRIDTLAAERPPAPDRPAPEDDRPAPAVRIDAPERATRMFEAPPRAADTHAQPTTRLALPGSGTIRPEDYPAPSAPSAGEGLSPLAARFSTFGGATSPLGEPPAAKRLELPGTVARDLGIPGFGDDDAGSNPFATMPASPPSTRLSLPGTVAGGFTEMPSIDLPSIKPMAPPSLPPSESTLRREAFDPPAIHRPDSPGDLAASATAEPAVPSPSMIDIRAILRGEPAPSPTAPGADAEPAPSPRKTTFTTGPIQPEVERGTPLGAVPFDPNLLHVREPVPLVIEPPTPRSPTTSLGIVADFGEPTTYDAAGSERVGANGRLIDLDATRLVEDFDLPDTGFETHVFSTAELVEGESLGFPSFPASMPDAEPPPAPPPAPALVTPIRAAAPALGSAVGLSPLQEEQAQAHIAELAELVDVVFARLIGADGSVILSAGDDDGDSALNGHLASLVKTAAMEVQQIDLGGWQSVSVESAGVALLVSPVNTGATLAVLLRNPTRLGLLRRQIRKPLAGLRSLLAESIVS